MYYIKKDKRSERSANSIYLGLVDTLKIKSLNNVTISDICNISGVSRATFYRIFDNITDVLYMKCDLCFKEVLEGFVKKYDILKIDRFSLMHYYINYWLNNSEILELLIKNNRLDIIFYCHRENSKIISNKFLTHSKLTQIELKYLLALRSGETISILISWIEGNKKESVEELFIILKKIYNISEKNVQIIL